MAGLTISEITEVAAKLRSARLHPHPASSREVASHNLLNRLGNIEGCHDIAVGDLVYDIGSMIVCPKSDG